MGGVVVLYCSREEIHIYLYILTLIQDRSLGHFTHINRLRFEQLLYLGPPMAGLGTQNQKSVAPLVRRAQLRPA